MLRKLNNSGNNISSLSEIEDMGKTERRQIVLEFLAEYELALPQGVIYRNLRYLYGITFSYGSVDGYLDEFVSEGLVRRVEPAGLENRQLVDLSEGQGSAYYIITEEGRSYLDSESEQESNASASSSTF